MYNFRLGRFPAIIIIILSMVSRSYAEDTDTIDYSNNFLGNWNGTRTKLYEYGIDIQPSYCVDGIYNLSGGIKKRGAVLDNTGYKILC